MVVGDLVWGKVKGHGFWPGRYVDHTKPEHRHMTPPASKLAVLVKVRSPYYYYYYYYYEYDYYYYYYEYDYYYDVQHRSNNR